MNIKVFLKKAPWIFIAILGLFAIYGGFHKILFKGGFSIEVLGAWGFGIALICVGISELFNRLNSIFLTFVENRFVVYLYAIGSIGFAVCCFVFACMSFGLNIKAILGIIGTIFFGIGPIVILFFDWRDFARRYNKMEYMDEVDTWVIMDGNTWSKEMNNWIEDDSNEEEKLYANIKINGGTKMIRDKRKDELYFSTVAQNIQEKNNENIKQYIGKDGIKKVAYFMVATGLCAEFSIKYSFGESLKNLEAVYNKMLEYYAFGIQEKEGDVYNVTLTVISLGILFDTDKTRLQQFYEIIELYKYNDFIFSSMLQPIVQHKEIYQKLRFKRNKSIQMLEKILNSNKKDAELLMKEYLEKHWYTKTNLGEAYNSHKTDGYNYVGYWAWEAAAIVKILKLDDSSFKDNPYYSYDLVHEN